MVYNIQFITDNRKLANKIFNRLKKEKFKKLVFSKTDEKTGRWKLIKKLPKEERKKKRKDMPNRDSGFYMRNHEMFDVLDEEDNFCIT